MYSLYRQLIALTEEFEEEFSVTDHNINNFSNWLLHKVDQSSSKTLDVSWEGKENGRSVESIINTSFIHLYRYAKIYSKQAISHTPFSTIDDVIFLINLLHLGEMSRTRLIEINIHEKSTGTQIINRLLIAGFIKETANSKDKRSKYISISQAGQNMLNRHMESIREASRIVVGNLTEGEKMELIRLLQKLETFHQDKLKTTNI